MKPEARSRLFHPFFTTKPNGNGLGLAVSRNIVREHGGRIDVLPQNGRGTAFEVVLPRAEALVRQSVLIVDDEGLIRRSLTMVLEGAGYDVQSAASGADALAQLAEEPPDCVLIDLRLGDMDGLDVLRAARERVPMPKAIVITAHGDVDSAVSSLRLGAFDFIRKPFDVEEVLASVKNALHTEQLERQVAYLSGQRADLLYESPGHAAPPWSGWSGWRPSRCPSSSSRARREPGRSWRPASCTVARQRAKGPFIELNCSAIPESLVESELFGHERGAFSDAREQKRGLVELADGGTLFLDEIGDLPGPAQAKLLRFVESREFRRVGGTRLLSVDCRVVAATHQALEGADSLSPRPVLPARRDDHHATAAARARRRRAPAGAQFPRGVRAAVPQAAGGLHARGGGAAAEPPLAGERARAQDRHRVGRGDG